MAPITIVVFRVAVGAIPVVKEAVVMSMSIAATTMVAVVVVAKEMMVGVTVGAGWPPTSVHV